MRNYKRNSFENVSIEFQGHCHGRNTVLNTADTHNFHMLNGRKNSWWRLLFHHQNFIDDISNVIFSCTHNCLAGLIKQILSNLIEATFQSRLQKTLKTLLINFFFFFRRTCDLSPVADP